MKVVQLLTGLVVAAGVATACGKTQGRSEGPYAGASGAGEAAGGTGGNPDGVGSGATSGGSAGNGGAAGARGDGGNAGGAGSAGDAAASGAPAVAPYRAEGCDGKPLELDEQRVANCVLLVSCTGGRRSPEEGGGLRLAECVDDGLLFRDVATGGDPGASRYLVAHAVHQRHTLGRVHPNAR